MYQLNNLTSLVKKRKRIGRGGSRGGTSGKGNKGQKARSGHSRMRPGFEGGQMPLIRRIPKRGFNNANFARSYAIVNLDVLEKSFENGQEVTRAALINKGLIRKKQDLLVKILGNGALSKKLIVYADAISQSAQDAIRQCGGEIHLTKEI